MIWRMAWRNLWRHRARTLIMGSAVAFIYGLALVSLGINDDGHRRMLEEATGAAGGDVLVHADGYWSTRASDRVILDGAEVHEAVRKTRGVDLAIPRVLVDGLLSTSAAASAVLLQGVDPALEARHTDPAEDLVRGTFLDGDRPDPLVLGARLVERLELELGDRVVLTAADPEGEMTRALFHLTGVLETGARGLDEVLGYTTLEAARGAVAMEGMYTQVGVLTAGGVSAESVALRIRENLGPGAAELEILTWREAVPEMVGYIELDDALGYLYMGVLLLVVLFSITNTFLMAVMERVRELGLLNALGMRGGRIGRLLLAETVLLTGLAMGAGLALGYGGHLAVDHWGISVAAYGIEEIEISGLDLSELVFYSTIDPLKWTIASVLVAVATVASALYPAWRASRLSPAEAMRFYE
ncbi:MAG: ABC transporter permease [Gemmatimonadota bacterium]